VKALTIRQPYAWAVARGDKLVENRTRPVSFRGDVAIHAGAAWYRGAERDPNVIDLWRLYFGSARPDAADLAAQGWWRCVICVADLYDSHAPEPGCCASPWADPGAGAHLLLRDVRRLERWAPARGALGLWTLPDDVERAVCEQLPAPAVPL
jgi:hypothetical protein